MRFAHTHAVAIPAQEDDANPFSGGKKGTLESDIARALIIIENVLVPVQDMEVFPWMEKEHTQDIQGTLPLEN